MYSRVYAYANMYVDVFVQMNVHVGIQMNVQPRELRRRVRAQSAYSNMSTLKPTAPSPQPGCRTEYLLIHPSKSIELVNRQTRQMCRLGLWNRR